jgi:hypothetical protein
MKSPFDDVSCASLPADALPRLAGLRGEPGVQVALEVGRLWLRFEPGAERVVRKVLPLAGAELFTSHGGTWRRFGQSLPAFDVPADLSLQPLSHVLFPAPVQPVPPGDAAITPVRLNLALDDRARATTAMLCPLATLVAWADTVPAARLARLYGVTRGGEALVIGELLPVLDSGERFWGRLVLIPLGLRPEPDLPESALRAAAGVRDDELLLLRPGHADAVPRAALGRLSRAALRLAAEGVAS